MRVETAAAKAQMIVSHARSKTETALGSHALKARPPQRLFHVFAGAVLILASSLLWMMPVHEWSQQAQLLKLGICAAGLLSGASLVAPFRSECPEVLLDPRAERLQVVYRNDFGRVGKIETFSYADLSEVDVRDGVFIARDHQGRTVVKLPLGAELDDLEAMRAALGRSFARSA